MFILSSCNTKPELSNVFINKSLWATESYGVWLPNMALLQPEKGTAITIVIEFINIVISTEPKAFY